MVLVGVNSSSSCCRSYHLIESVGEMVSQLQKE